MKQGTIYRCWGCGFRGLIRSGSSVSVREARCGDCMARHEYDPVAEAAYYLAVRYGFPEALVRKYCLREGLPFAADLDLFKAADEALARDGLGLPQKVVSEFRPPAAPPAKSVKFYALDVGQIPEAHL